MNTIINNIAAEFNISKKFAKQLVQATLSNIITDVQSNGRTALGGFGIFTSKRRNARSGVNPRNPQEKITIPAHTVLSFKASAAVKKIFN